jgi:hypothetical protein
MSDDPEGGDAEARRSARMARRQKRRDRALSQRRSERESTRPPRRRRRGGATPEAPAPGAPPGVVPVSPEPGPGVIPVSGPAPTPPEIAAVGAAPAPAAQATPGAPAPAAPPAAPKPPPLFIPRSARKSVAVPIRVPDDDPAPAPAPASPPASAPASAPAPAGKPAAVPAAAPAAAAGAPAAAAAGAPAAAAGTAAAAPAARAAAPAGGESGTGPVSPLRKRYRGRPPLRWTDPRKASDEEDGEDEAATASEPLLAGVPGWQVVVVGVLLLVLPFLTKPVHLDDANFLALARGAAADPWRPHDIRINWQGTTERAFDVLSNPPGIAWWLAPVADLPVWAQHAWMLPWLALALWGAWKLGDRLTGAPVAATLLLCASPIGLLSAHALMPDLPLFACTLAGAAGLISTAPRRAWPWALLLGSAALFRYSGLALIPVAALWGYLAGERRDALTLGLAALAPFALLAGHDMLAYGEVHFVAMMDFQGVSGGPRDVLRKLLAAMGAFGGAALLPILCWRRPGGALLGAFAGVGLGLVAAGLSGHEGLALGATVLAIGAGGASLGGGVWTAIRERDRETVWLLVWGLGGLVFLLGLRFTAARYWVPFLAPWVLLTLRGAGPRLVRAAVGATVSLSLLLAMSDLRLSRAQHSLALRVLALTEGEPGLVAGHWGWQHHLEGAGWTPLEDDAEVPFGALLATSAISWPQTPAEGCFREVAVLSAPPAMVPGPRVHTASGLANLHAFVVSGKPPIETYAPWGFGRDPLDVVRLERSCGPGSGAL